MTEHRFQLYRKALRNRLDAHATCCGGNLSWQILDRAVEGRSSFADRAVILSMQPNDPDYTKRSARAARRLYLHHPRRPVTRDEC